MCLFLAFVFWTSILTFAPANRKGAFIELTSFKSLFFVKFQAFTLDESHHLLVKQF